MGEGAGRTIMVVEDYDDTRQMLKAVLEAQGYRVLEAVNGQEAVEVATTAHPDLILMDLDLPILDGIEATNRIRLHAGLKGVPIIAVTAYPMSFTRVRAFSQGCSGYIEKPIDFSKLNGLIEKHLGAGA